MSPVSRAKYQQHSASDLLPSCVAQEDSTQGATTMPLYSYSALADNGATVAGETAADSESVLREELGARGLLVRDIRIKRQRAAFAKQKVTTEQFALFNQELTALVRAGLTVPDALALAAHRPDSPMLGKVLERVLADVRNGALLSEACARHVEVFDRLFLAALRTAEKTGDLAGVLARHQVHLRHQVAMRKRISQAMTYPLFLLFALVVIVAVLFVFVLPRFVAMYADLGAELPFPTRVLMSIVERLYIVGPLVAVSATVAVVTWRRWLQRDSAKRIVHQFYDRLPWIGESIRISVIAVLARSLATLLAGGTPLVEALRTIPKALDNQVVLDRLAQATRAVSEGRSLAAAARETRLLPPMAARMVEVGEASGSLDKMLVEVAQFYEEALDSRLARMSALIEPIMMLLMGVIIGGIIIVMYLPVFHVADIIK